MSLNTTSRPYVAIAVAVVAVSFASIFIRWSNSHPLAIATYRMGFASLILAPLVIVRLRRTLMSLSKRQTCAMLFTGVVLATHFAFWISSLAMTSVASSVILVSSHPLLVAFLSHYFLKDKLNMLQVIGIVLGLLGVLVIAYGDYGIGEESFVGDLFALVGGVMGGVYIIAGRKLRQKVALVPYAFVVYSASTVMLVAVSLALNVGLAPALFSVKEFVLFLALAFVSTILGHTMYNWALRYVPAHVVSISLIGEPIGACLLALIFLGEAPTIYLLAGGAVALFGVYLTSRIQLLGEQVID